MTQNKLELYTTIYKLDFLRVEEIKALKERTVDSFSAQFFHMNLKIKKG